MEGPNIFILAALLFSLVLISGCVTQPGATTGSFVLLISDSEADIADFDSLEVTFSKARIFKSGNGQDAGFEEIPFSATVDLTQVIGEKSIEVLEISLAEGRYTKIELFVSVVIGIVNGSEANVTVPSGKLQISRPFVISANETVKFVFDINVAKKGHDDDYNLMPVIGKSGVVGKTCRKSRLKRPSARSIPIARAMTYASRASARTGRPKCRNAARIPIAMTERCASQESARMKMCPRCRNAP
jgi:hypothetical protein